MSTDSIKHVNNTSDEQLKNIEYLPYCDSDEAAVESAVARGKVASESDELLRM